MFWNKLILVLGRNLLYLEVWAVANIRGVDNFKTAK